MAATDKPDSVLDLSTLVDRPQVKIDDELYPLKHPDEFSLTEQLRLKRNAKRVVELVDKMTDDASTEEEEREYEQIVDQTCRAVLQAPDEVHKRLRDEHRIAINRAFTQLQSETIRRRTEAPDETAAPTTTTGESSSPNSVDSTAAIPSAGSQ